jgi:hypothetical protein
MSVRKTFNSSNQSKLVSRLFRKTEGNNVPFTSYGNWPLEVSPISLLTKKQIICETRSERSVELYRGRNLDPQTVTVTRMLLLNDT